MGSRSTRLLAAALRLDADGVEAAAPNSPADYRNAVSRDVARLEKFFRTPGISMDAFR